MEEYTISLLQTQQKMVEDTFIKIKLNPDKYSEKVISNFHTLLQDIIKLSCALMESIQNGKMYKTPRKYSNLKKKKEKAAMAAIQAAPELMQINM